MPDTGQSMRLHLPMAPGRGSEQVFAVVSWFAAALVVALFAWIVSDLLRGGVAQLSWSFLLEEPLQAGRAGGIAPILIATLWILLICLSFAVPIGLATAILLAEYGEVSGLAGWVRRSLDVLAGVPSIVFGLFGNALFCVIFGFGFSILAGGLTLACMVLPIFIRLAEAGLRAVPAEYRLAAAALGLSRTRTLLAILLPAAAPAILVGLVLGIGRAMAETAALLFTSGYVYRMPESAMDSGRALSIHIYDLSMNIAGGEANAYASALVLLTLLMAINALAVAIAQRVHQRLRFE